MVVSTGEAVLDFVRRLHRAMSHFESGIRAAIPKGVVVCDRQTSRQIDVAPCDPSYPRILGRFEKEVSSNQAIAVLFFLYEFEVHGRSNWAWFEQTHGSAISPDRIARVKYGFPNIDQTTVAEILSRYSSSIVGNRLDDLSRIGLVSRSELPPPSPKHVRITEKGILLFEKAAREGIDTLAPVLDQPIAKPKVG